MLWLVLPQTQGATKLYFEYVHPTLTKHETEIEEFISRAHDQAKAVGAEYVQRAFEILKQLIFGALPQAAAEEAPPAPIPHDAASFAQALFSRWRVPPLTPYAPQMATDFYAFLSSALQQAGTGGSAGTGTSNLIPPHIKGTAEKKRFIELQKQRLQTVMAALETEMERGGADTSAAGSVDTAAASADAGSSGGLFKSYSQGHLSTYEGDFDHVEMADAAVPASTPPVASGGGWLFGWGAAAKPVEKNE